MSFTAGVPEGLLKLKFAQTDSFYDDPNTVNNFMLETIRNTGSDKPLFESDLPRSSRNPLNSTIMTMQEHGGRYTHAPYHPELFLGDLTKDQRSTVNEPMVAQMAQQNKFRQTRYIERKLQDVADVRTEGMVGEKEMLRQVNTGFSATASRLGSLFSESSKVGAAGMGLKPGNTTQKLGDVVYQNTKTFRTVDDKVLPFYAGSDPKMMKTMLNAQYEATPDTEAGTSSTANTYKAKHENVDQSQLAAERQGDQDTTFKSERSDIQVGFQAQSVETFRNDRKNRYTVEVLTNKDSVNNKYIKGMLPPPAPTSQVPKSLLTQKKKEQITSKGSRLNAPGKHGHQESLVEHMASTSKVATKRGVTIPVKDRIAIAKRVQQTQVKSKRSEDKSKTRSAKALTKAFTKRAEAVYDQKVKEAMKATHTANGLPSKPADLVSRGKLEEDKTKFANERAMANRTGSNATPTAPAIEQFDFDTDPTMNNESQAIRGGSQRTNVRLEQAREDMDTVSPLIDSVAPFRTKYRSN